MAQITFKVASVADSSFLLTKIIFVVAEIIIIVNVITSYVAKNTFIVAKIIINANVITSYVAENTFIVAEIICKVALVTLL